MTAAAAAADGEQAHPRRARQDANESAKRLAATVTGAIIRTPSKKRELIGRPSVHERGGPEGRRRRPVLPVGRRSLGRRPSSLSGTGRFPTEVGLFEEAQPSDVHAGSGVATPRAMRSGVIDAHSEKRTAPEPAISQSVVVNVPVRSRAAPRSSGATAPSM